MPIISRKMSVQWKVCKKCLTIKFNLGEVGHKDFFFFKKFGKMNLTKLNMTLHTPWASPWANINYQAPKGNDTFTALTPRSSFKKDGLGHCANWANVKCHFAEICMNIIWPC